MPTGTDAAVDRGIGFLERQQLPTGTFSLRVGFDLASDEVVQEDHNLFSAAMVAYSLLRCEHPGSGPIVDRAVAYLLAHAEPGGVWRYYAPGDPKYGWVAPDVDDTSCISSLLRALGRPVPDNREVILANRDPRGLFYTWIAPRRPLPRSLAWWRVAARRWRHPRESRKLWTESHSRLDDVDAIVNANVLAYLGDGAHAGPVVARLIEVFRAREDHRCDKWYRGPYVFAYAVSRAALGGVQGLYAIREESVDRLRAAAGEDGRIGDGPLDTALAVCALRSWEADVPEAEAARDYLRASQSPEGSWPTAAYYFGGSVPDDPTVLSWGAEALTTGFCLEALSAPAP